MLCSQSSVAFLNCLEHRNTGEALRDSAVEGGTLENEEAPEGILRWSCKARPTSVVNCLLSYCYDREK